MDGVTKSSIHVRMSQQKSGRVKTEKYCTVIITDDDSDLMF